MRIMLQHIWPIENASDFKVHFARFNKHSEPLDVFAQDRDGWTGWQRHRSRKDRFNRPFIFSLAKYYHETDIWLFGGVYKVMKRHEDWYEVELTTQGACFIGRLKLHSPYRAMNASVRLENQYADFEVREVLREPYTGRAFSGFQNIDLSFLELEALVRNERPDWRVPLESVAGIYLIAVRKAGTIRRYVGAAYGGQGVWSRWANYVDTGHGQTAELRRLVGEKGIDYCRQHFRFALLEHMAITTPIATVQAREKHWKQVLGTGGPDDLNRN